MQLETGGNALVAGDLAEIRDRGGNLEWAVQFLFGAERVVGDRVIAGASEPGTEGGAGGEDVELDGLSLPNTCGDTGPGVGGKTIKGISAGPVAGWPSVSVTEYVFCRVTANWPNGIDCLSVVPTLPCSLDGSTRASTLPMFEMPTDAQAAPELELSRVVGKG
jgi:hypothetical protein